MGAKFDLYRLYYQRQAISKGEYKLTQVTFKARNQEEAMRKADKFWIQGDMGLGSIMVKKELKTA